VTALLESFNRFSEGFNKVTKKHVKFNLYNDIIELTIIMQVFPAGGSHSHPLPVSIPFREFYLPDYVWGPVMKLKKYVQYLICAG